MIFTKLTESGEIVFNESSDGKRSFESATKAIQSKLSHICYKIKNDSDVKNSYNPKMTESSKKDYTAYYHLYPSFRLYSDNEKYHNIDKIASELEKLKYSECKYIKSVNYYKYDGDICVNFNPDYIE